MEGRAMGKLSVRRRLHQSDHGAFVGTFPTPGTNPRRGYKYSGIYKQAQPVF